MILLIDDNLSVISKSLFVIKFVRVNFKLMKKNVDLMISFPSDSRTLDGLGFALRNLVISCFAFMVFNYIVLHSNRGQP